MGVKTRLLPPLIGIVVLVILLANINIKETANILFSANPIYLLAAILMIAPTLALQAARWKIIMKRLGMAYSFKETLKMVNSSIFIGQVTPARLGEFIRVTFIKSHGLGKAILSVVSDRLSDVIFISIIGYLGMSLLPDYFGHQMLLITIAAIALIAIALFLNSNKPIMMKALRMIFQRLVPPGMKANIKETFYEFYFSASRLKNAQTIATIITFTSAIWLISFLQTYLLSKSIGMNVSIIEIATINSVASLLSILPISFSGIGTRDMSFVLFFSLLGITSERAIALSTLVLGINILITLACLPFWLMSPVRFDQQKQ